MDILKSNCPKWEDDLFYAYPNGFLFIGFSNKKTPCFSYNGCLGVYQKL